MHEIQTVQITLSDGRSGLFSGPALVMDGNTPLSVTDILFHAPRQLAPGCEFININEITRHEAEAAEKTKTQASAGPPVAKSRRAGSSKKPHHEGGRSKGKDRPPSSSERHSG